MKNQHFFNVQNQKPSGAAHLAAGGELNQNKTAFHHEKHHEPPVPPAAAPVPQVKELCHNETQSHSPLSTEEVSTRAYFVFLNLGSNHGNDVEHWLNAEAELLAERNLTRTHGYPGRK